MEIIHTEFQYISLIEMQKYNLNRKRIEKRKTGKKGLGWQHILSRLVLPTGTKDSLLSRLPDPGQKDPPPLLSRPGVPGWETGTTRVSQPGQISLSVVVYGWLCDHGVGLLLVRGVAKARAWRHLWVSRVVGRKIYVLLPNGFGFLIFVWLS